MVWVKLDDRFAEHPKVAELSDQAFRAHVSALCYCARNETDGKIPRSVVRMLGSSEELEAAGLWHRTETGHAIHGFLDYNPSAASIREKREQAAERMRRVRANSERTSQEPVSTPSPSPSPIPDPEPEYRNPSDSSSAGADTDRFEAWFRGAWNRNAPDLPAVRSVTGARLRNARAFLKAAGGDRDLVERAIAAFGSWRFALDQQLGADTFLRAKNRDRQLEWAETGPPQDNGSVAIRREQRNRQALADFVNERTDDAGHGPPRLR